MHAWQGVQCGARGAAVAGLELECFAVSRFAATIPTAFRRRRTLKASEPGERLTLSVAASHPELGDFFLASLSARVDAAAPAAPSERAGLRTLLR